MQRLLLLVGTCVPLLVVTAVVIVVPADHPYYLLISGGLATLFSVTLAILITQRQSAAFHATEQLSKTLALDPHNQEEWERAIDLLPRGTAADPYLPFLKDLGSKLSQRDARIKEVIDLLTAAMTSLVHGRKIPSLATIQLPNSIDRLVLLGTYREFIHALVELRRRAGALANVLHRLPVAVVVCNRHGRICSLNVAAERLLGRRSKSAVGKSLLRFFADAPLGTKNPANLLLIQKGSHAYDRLREGEPREVFTTVKSTRGRKILVGMRGYFDRQHHVLIFRERNPKPYSGQPASAQDAETVPAREVTRSPESATATN